MVWRPGIDGLPSQHAVCRKLAHLLECEYRQKKTRRQHNLDAETFCVIVKGLQILCGGFSSVGRGQRFARDRLGVGKCGFRGKIVQGSNSYLSYGPCFDAALLLAKTWVAGGG